MNSRLVFLSFVLARLGIEASDLLGSFDARLRVQKVIYLLNALGLGPRYDFDLYLRGPYSRALADDYMALARLGDNEIRALAGYYKDDGELSSALDMLSGASDAVLEVAATLHMLMTAYRERYPGTTLSDVLDHLLFLKPWASEYIGKALNLLKNLGLIDANYSL
ncbi:hypothetical protein [Vulcanisaeta thermophila]|uniref:hypothetical protein n=1 Tax=Vulcanisaeta thermophila TaxID=867917 RepID=UPI0008538BDE|nr:hypothetical protein [Vulcanisaeta thermophila]